MVLFHAKSRLADSTWLVSSIDGCLSRTEDHCAILAVIEPTSWHMEYLRRFIPVIQDCVLVGRSRAIKCA